MPERSEWLLAGGGAKRNPRYRATHHYAKNANIGFFGNRFRVFQTLFLGEMTVSRGLRWRLTPGYKHSGYCPRHSTFQVGYLAHL